MTDREVIEYLRCFCKFDYVMEDDRCTSLSFHDEREVFGGTIRKHPLKHLIIEMAAKLAHLKYLNLRKCKLGHLPELNSRDLEYVDISCNDLGSVPTWIPKQRSLKFLNLGANQIREIPNLCELPLEVLKLHKNLISHLPELGTKIKSLNLFINQMDSIPAQVFTLPLLEVFTFGVTSMRSLHSLSTLPNLRWLTLTVNQIENLPDDICSLRNLEGLQLAKNRLRKLPERIGDMNLRALTLYSNELSRLPESFFNLKLKKLNLSSNPLKEKFRIQETFGGIDFVSL